MTPKAARILVQVLLLGWALSIYSLYPLPTKGVEYLDQNRATLHDIVVAEARSKGQQLSGSEIAVAVENRSRLETTRIWERWLVRVATVVLGAVCVSFYLLQPRNGWLWAVIAASTLFLGVWTWPYVTTGDSIVDSYRSFASGVIALGSWRLLGEFLLFNAVLPTVHAVAVVALLLFASGRAKSTVLP